MGCEARGMWIFLEEARHREDDCEQQGQNSPGSRGAAWLPKRLYLALQEAKLSLNLTPQLRPVPVPTPTGLAGSEGGSTQHRMCWRKKV